MLGTSFLPEMLILGGGNGWLVGNFAPSLFILGGGSSQGTTFLKELDDLLLKDLDPQTLRDLDGVPQQG